MPYEIMATSRTPALILYLLDVSASMGKPLGSRRRIDVVVEALTAALRQMVFRSTKGGRLSPRYRIGLLAYSDHVYDLLDGFKTVDQVAALGVPELSTMRATDTARAFRSALRLIEAELPALQECPAPLVCHMTDGEFTSDDPAPIARQLMGLSVPDGSVLVENIFIADSVTKDPIGEPTVWPGVTERTQLASDYARKLRSMSSKIPESYRAMMLESNYRLDQGAYMLLPGTTPELVAMGFQMSAATPVR